MLASSSCFCALQSSRLLTEIGFPEEVGFVLNDDNVVSSMITRACPHGMPLFFLGHSVGHSCDYPFLHCYGVAHQADVVGTKPKGHQCVAVVVEGGEVVFLDGQVFVV